MSPYSLNQPEIDLKAASKWAPFGVLFLIIGFGLFQSFYIVPPDSKGVLLRFGTFYMTEQPGPHLKFPFNIDNVHIVSTEKVFTQEFGFRSRNVGRSLRSSGRNMSFEDEALQLTGDLNSAIIKWVVHYRIMDPVKYIFTLEDPEATIHDLSESVMRRLVGERSIDENITTGRVELGAMVKIELQKLLDEYNCGILLVTINLQDATPPPEVQDAFDNVNRSEQEKDKMIKEAERNRNKIIPEAKGDADRLISEAEGYAIRVVAEAKGETNAFDNKWKQYKKAPKITKNRLYLETMEEVLSKINDKVIIDKSIKNFLPLMNLGGDKINFNADLSKTSRGGK